ncbi:hypothetical protein D3C76_1087010 [compost metagenome]
MEQDLKRVTEWINNKLDQTITIQKKEQEDIDQVSFKVSQFDIRYPGEAKDDYLDSAIVLKGTGSTMNSDGDYEPLPQNTYEIIIADLEITNINNEEVELTTTRAKYSISSQ